MMNHALFSLNVVLLKYIVVSREIHSKIAYCFVYPGDTFSSKIYLQNRLSISKIYKTYNGINFKFIKKRKIFSGITEFFIVSTLKDLCSTMQCAKFQHRSTRKILLLSISSNFSLAPFSRANHSFVYKLACEFRNELLNFATKFGIF